MALLAGGTGACDLGVGFADGTNIWIKSWSGSIEYGQFNVATFTTNVPGVPTNMTISERITGTAEGFADGAAMPVLPEIGVITGVTMTLTTGTGRTLSFLGKITNISFVVGANDSESGPPTLSFSFENSGGLVTEV